MTVEQIETQIKALQARKKEELKKQKQKELLAQRKLNAQKRKKESRIKYIIGGYMLSEQPDIINKILKSNKLREQDKKALEEFKNNS